MTPYNPTAAINSPMMPNIANKDPNRPNAHAREATSIEHPGVLGPRDHLGAGGLAIAGSLWQILKSMVKRPFYSFYLRRLRQ